MSLFWNRKRIESMVLGELSSAAERELFVHLRGCAACRAHYDTLSMGMDALSTSTRDSRERARVLVGGEPVAPASSSRPVWLIPLAVGVAATVLVLVLVNLKPSGDDDLVLRGGVDDGGHAPEFSLLAYARTGEGPVRLAADLPLGVGSVSREERVQFFVKHSLVAAHVKVTGVGPDGASRVLAEGDVGSTVEKSSAVGSAIELSSLAPGKWMIEASLVGDGGAPLVVRGAVELKP